jgi:hypothetical protein
VPGFVVYSDCYGLKVNDFAFVSTTCVFYCVSVFTSYSFIFSQVSKLLSKVILQVIAQNDVGGMEAAIA